MIRIISVIQFEYVILWIIIDVIRIVSIIDIEILIGFFDKIVCIVENVNKMNIT